MNLENIKVIFDERHDFEDEDIDTLKERWPNISFYNIPVAWIVPIDEMLCRIKYNNPVYQVRQEFGQFVVLSRHLNEKQKRVINGAEDTIYCIDEDLRVR